MKYDRISLLGNNVIFKKKHRQPTFLPSNLNSFRLPLFLNQQKSV